MGYKIRRRFSKKRLNKTNRTKLNGGSNNNTISKIELQILTLDQVLSKTQKLIDKLNININTNLQKKIQTDNYRLQNQYHQEAKTWFKVRKAREADADKINEQIKGLEDELNKLNKSTVKATTHGQSNNQLLNVLPSNTNMNNQLLIHGRPLPREFYANSTIINTKVQEREGNRRVNKSRHKKTEGNSFLNKIKQRWKKFRTKKKPIPSNTNTNMNNQLLIHGRPLPREFYANSTTNNNVRDRERNRHFKKYLLENKSYNKPQTNSIFNILHKNVLNFRKTKKGTKKKKSTFKSKQSKQIKQNVCTNCGKVLEPNNMFCTECGTKIELTKVKSIPTVKSKKIPQNYCTECGTVLDPNNMFCTECGSRIKNINNEDRQINIPDTVDIDNIRLPKWFNNSCFLDSVIACLLIRPNKYLINRLLEKPLIDLNVKSDCTLESRQNIRNELINVFNFIHNNQTKSKESKELRNFRESLGKCNLNTFESFTGSSQQEANEFLKYLFASLPGEDKQNLSETVYFTDDIDTPINVEKDIQNLNGNTCISRNNQNTDVYYFISPSDISNVINTSVKLSSFLNSKDDSIVSEGSTFLCDSKDYKRTIKFKIFEEERYIIFDLSRAFAGQFLDQKITPDEEIELSNGKKFKFVSSVHRTSGLGSAHFTSFILLNDIWYYYDDLGNKLKEVGNYSDLLKNEKIMQCVMYFYEPMSPS